MANKENDAFWQLIEGQFDGPRFETAAQNQQHLEEAFAEADQIINKIDNIVGNINEVLGIELDLDNELND